MSKAMLANRIGTSRSALDRPLAPTNASQTPDSELAYWRLASGVEVDFIVDDLRVAIGAKATRAAHADHLSGLRSLVDEHRAGRRILVSLDERPRRTDDGIEILRRAPSPTACGGGGIIAG